MLPCLIIPFSLLNTFCRWHTPRSRSSGWIRLTKRSNSSFGIPLWPGVESEERVTTLLLTRTVRPPILPLSVCQRRSQRMSRSRFRHPVSWMSLRQHCDGVICPASNDRGRGLWHGHPVSKSLLSSPFSWSCRWSIPSTSGLAWGLVLRCISGSCIPGSQIRRRCEWSLSFPSTVQGRVRQRIPRWYLWLLLRPPLLEPWRGSHLRSAWSGLSSWGILP